MRENEVNIQLRGIYLTTLERYKEEKRHVYMDETWLNKNTQPSCIWHDNLLDTVDNVSASGKGQRWIVLGADSKGGCLENSIKIWKGNTK